MCIDRATELNEREKRALHMHGIQWASHGQSQNSIWCKMRNSNFRLLRCFCVMLLILPIAMTTQRKQWKKTSFNIQANSLASCKSTIWNWRLLQPTLQMQRIFSDSEIRIYLVLYSSRPLFFCGGVDFNKKVTMFVSQPGDQVQINGYYFSSFHFSISLLIVRCSFCHDFSSVIGLVVAFSQKSIFSAVKKICVP